MDRCDKNCGRQSSGAKFALWACYLAATLFLLWRHELWRDEIQAWLIARDLSPWGVILQMRYEGHLALWSLILWPFAHAGAPVVAVNLTAWALSAAAAYMLVFRAPFSLTAKGALLFSGGMLYFFPVVGRCYALFAPLVFALAALYPRRTRCPARYALLIVLLAYTHAFAAGMAAVLGGWLLWDLWNVSDGEKTGARRGFYWALAILAAGAVSAAAQVVPALFFSRTAAEIEPWQWSQAPYRIAASAGVFASDFVGSQKLLSETLFGFMGGRGAACAAAGWRILFIVTAAYGAAWLYLASRKAFVILLAGMLWPMTFSLFLYCFLPPRAAMFLIWCAFCVWIAAEQGCAPERLARLQRWLIALSLLGVIGWTGFIAHDACGSFSDLGRCAARIRRESPEKPVLFVPQSDFTAISGYLPEYTIVAAQDGREVSFARRDREPLPIEHYPADFLLTALPGRTEFLLLAPAQFDRRLQRYIRELTKKGGTAEKLYSSAPIPEVHRGYFFYEGFVLYAVSRPPDANQCLP